MGQGTSARGLASPLSTPPADVQTVLWGDETSLPHTRWSFQSVRGMVRSSTASLSLLFPVSVTPLDLTCISFNPWSGLQLSEWQGSLHILVLMHMYCYNYYYYCCYNWNKKLVKHSLLKSSEPCYIRAVRSNNRTLTLGVAYFCYVINNDSALTLGVVDAWSCLLLLCQ